MESMPNIELAITGLLGVKEILEPLLLKINYEGLGEDDVKELKEHLELAVEALEKQIPKMVDFKHERGDEVALITCPICNRSIIANLERYEEFNKEWYCKKCGQLLTLEES